MGQSTHRGSIHYVCRQADMCVYVGGVGWWVSGWGGVHACAGERQQSSNVREAHLGKLEQQLIECKSLGITSAPFRLDECL